jgi:hypothetical protein
VSSIRPPVDPEIPRTQGVGVWRLAEEYLEAAAAASTPRSTRIPFVSYYLYGHGLELALKAFLVSQGTTDRRLRRLGHDLKRALKAARKHQPFKAVSITPTDCHIVAWLNSYYKVKEFEYLVTGYKSFPSLRDVRRVSEHVLGQLQAPIWQAARLAIAPESPT